MYVSGDPTSSQEAQRQRRHAAEERSRVDRAAADTALREGQARSPGAAPARSDVDRFRTLMAGLGADRAQQGASPQQKPGRAPPENGSATARAEASVGTGGRPEQSAPPPTAFDRFKALFQGAPRSVDAGGSERTGGQRSAESEAGEGNHAAPSSGGSATRAGAEGALQSQQRSDIRGAAADGQAPAALARGEGQKPLNVAEAAQRDEDNAARDSSGRDDGGSADASVKGRKAAEIEVQAGRVTRHSRSGRNGTADGSDKDSDALRTSGSGATPGQASPDTFAMMQAPRTGEGPQQAAASAGMIAPALADLIQKHVKQMLVSDNRGGRAGSREMLLRMQSDVLPGTDLWLTRTANGWNLRADVTSRDAYETLLANQTDLVERFAAGALGELSIEPVFHASEGPASSAGGRALLSRHER